MSKLLVSVRNLSEAALAFEHGAHIIDAKEPDRGSLGAVTPLIAEEIIKQLSSKTILSFALGELFEHLSDSQSPRLIEFARLLERHPGAFVKFGLSNICQIEGWENCWLQCQKLFPSQVQFVTVAYADAVHCNAPNVWELAQFACSNGSSALLIDTFSKNGRSLFEYLGIDDLTRLIEQLRRAGVQSVLAGSLTLDLIKKHAALAPDYWAVRGAVCSGDRSGSLDGQKVKQLRDVITNSVCCDVPISHT